MKFHITYEALKQIVITAKSRFKLAISCFVITSFYYGFETRSFSKENRAGVICAAALMLLMLVFRGFVVKEKAKRFDHVKMPVLVAAVTVLFGFLAGSTSIQEASNKYIAIVAVFLLLTALAFALVEYIFFDFGEIFEAARGSSVSEQELKDTLGFLYLCVWAFSIGGTFFIINFLD